MIPSKLELLAMSAHSALKTYCSMLGFPYAIPRWENLSETDMKFSVQITNLIQFRLRERDLKPSDVHTMWVKARVAMGYRFGHRRDRVNMTHPNLVPFDVLSAREQMKPKIILETIRLFGTIDNQSLSSGDVAHGF